MSEQQHTGGCLCGRILYQFQGPTKWCAHCHCSMCRRAHGAAFVTWFGVAKQQFRITKGSDQVGRFASSADATRSFCTHCGTTLLFESTRWGDEVHVTLASLQGELDRAPSAHVFFSDRAHWYQVGDRLPCRGGPSGTEPLDPA